MNNLNTVAFYTLGCKLNFSETSTISRNLEKEGIQKVDFNSKADLYIINTCSVTENANKECSRIIKKAKKNSPNSFVIITGCYAQLKPKIISEIQDVDLVIGANEKFNISKIISQNHTKKIHGCEINNLKYNSSFSLNDRTRSFLKIQDGCDFPCTYCTIPLARGKSRSDTIKNIIKKVHSIAKKDIKEIVLTGVNIGDFQDPETNEDFYDLICKLDKIKQISRFRISSIEPNLISDKIIEFVKNSKRFVPHFHIPLQSGSNDILKSMKRRYNAKLYQEKIIQISKEIPDVCIGADVIVGFPGESNKHFEDTLNFIKNLPINYLHVFPYSERENTIAFSMKNQVQIQERKERSKKLRILSNKLNRIFYSKYLGSTQKVLFEENKSGKMVGFTKNYIKVEVPYNKEVKNQELDVKLLSINEHQRVISKIL